MKRKYLIIFALTITFFSVNIYATEGLQISEENENNTIEETQQPVDNENNTIEETQQPVDNENNTTEEPQQPGNNENNTTEEPEIPESNENNNVVEEVPNIPQQPKPSTNTEIIQEDKSSNNNLIRLEVKDLEFEPAFETTITEYYLVVDLTVEKLEITAITEDIKATVNITGNEELIEGENTIIITVIAEDGTRKEYKIFVTKTEEPEKANAKLKTLKVEGADIYPTFSSQIYNYNLTINEKITELKVLAETENEKATIEITGNTSLKEGNNIIRIIVTAEDGQTKREYTINTYISEFNVKVKEENKIPAIIAIIVISIVVLTLYINIMKNRKIR